MIKIEPVTLEDRGIRLEPLEEHHHDDLVKASEDGKLWELWYTATPDASGMKKYSRPRMKMIHDPMRPPEMRLGCPVGRGNVSAFWAAYAAIGGRSLMTGATAR
jgi:hypothetical protein